MPNTPYIIEGCKSATGAVKPRLDILALQKVPKQFSLLIRAFNNIMKPDYKFAGSDAVNWEQLGGIHGMPYKEWSGDIKDANPGSDPKRWMGYCHHRDTLFPTWHRVTMLLVEQAIWKEANAIAGNISGIAAAAKEEWKQAADTLRFPYWDWTVPVVPGSTYLPDLFITDNISIVDFNGSTVSVKNPLHAYQFGPVHNTFTDHDDSHSYFKSWNRTYRWPTEVRVNPTERYDSLNNAFVNGGPGPEQHNVAWLRDKVAHLFTFQPTLDKKWSGNVWDAFSNVLQSGKGPDSSFMRTSLEESHDSVHLDIGANGHMGDNDVAAFDPIFWLHHCNVDRIYAFWEYVYPDYWIGTTGWFDPVTGTTKNFVTADGTYIEGEGAIINQATDLTPFRKSATAYWSSSDTHGLQLGKGTPKYYTYPPIVYGTTTVQVDQPFVAAKQTEYISALQKHWGLVLNVRLARNQLPVLDAPIFQRPVPGGIGCPSGYQGLGKFRIFVIVVTISEHAYEGSFHVELRPRGVPDVVINRVSFLRRRTADRCGACLGRQAAHSLVQATMILDSSEVRSLIHEAGLNRQDTRDEEIVNLLKTSFEARVTSPDGNVLAEHRHGLSGTPGTRPLNAGLPNLTFYSASAAHPIGNPNGDIRFFDWINHTTLLSDNWVDRR